MSIVQRTCDGIIEGGIIALLLFAPLAFGATHPLSYSVLQVGVFALVVVWIAKTAFGGATASRSTGLRALTLLIFAFAFVGLLQWLTIADWLPGTVCRFATRVALCKFLTPAMAFLLVAANLSRPDRIKRLMFAIVCMGAGIALLGILQMFTSSNTIYWRWSAGPGGRPFGPFVSGSQFAACMEMAIPIAIVSALWQGGHRHSAEAEKTRSRPKMILALAAYAIMALALFLCRSPQGVVGFLVSCLALLAFGLRGGTRKTRLSLGICMAGVFCLIAVWWRVWPMIGHSPIIGQTRMTVWSDSLRIWRSSPATGFGMGTFAHVFPLYKGASLGPIHWPTARSEPIQLLAEMGLAGLGIALLFFLIWWGAAFRAWRVAKDAWVRWMIVGGMTAACGILTHSLMESCFRAPANAFTFAVILGSVSALANSARQDKSAEKDKHGEE